MRRGIERRSGVHADYEIAGRKRNQKRERSRFSGPYVKEE